MEEIEKADGVWTFLYKMDIIIVMKQRRNEKKKTVQLLSMITQLGLIMIVSVGMTSALGVWLDQKLGKSYFTVAFFFLGAIAGGRGIYRTIKQIFEDEDKNDKKTKRD